MFDKRFLRSRELTDRRQSVRWGEAWGRGRRTGDREEGAGGIDLMPCPSPPLCTSSLRDFSILHHPDENSLSSGGSLRWIEEAGCLVAARGMQSWPAVTCESQSPCPQPRSAHTTSHLQVWGPQTWGRFHQDGDGFDG